jgi:hypothetical protein
LTTIHGIDNDCLEEFCQLGFKEGMFSCKPLLRRQLSIDKPAIKNERSKVKHRIYVRWRGERVLNFLSFDQLVAICITECYKFWRTHHLAVGSIISMKGGKKN